MLISFNRHKHRHAKPQLFRIQQSDTLSDDTCFFQLLNPPPAWGVQNHKRSKAGREGADQRYSLCADDKRIELQLRRPANR